MRKLIAIFLGLLICSYANAKVVIKPGEVPPAYLGKTLYGKSIDLPAFRGDVVVISFWATWCHFCIQELPVWGSIQKIAAQKGLHMQVVAVNYEQDWSVFYRVVHVLKPRVPELILTSDPNGKIGNTYGVVAIPVLVMLHRNGKVAYMHVGYDKSDLNTFIKEVNKLLSEPMPKQTQKS